MASEAVPEIDDGVAWPGAAITSSDVALKVKTSSARKTRIAAVPWFNERAQSDTVAPCQ